MVTVGRKVVHQFTEQEAHQERYLVAEVGNFEHSEESHVVVV
jgi:hypothetical protein